MGATLALNWLKLKLFFFMKTLICARIDKIYINTEIEIHCSILVKFGREKFSIYIFFVIGNCLLADYLLVLGLNGR